MVEQDLFTDRRNETIGNKGRQLGDYPLSARARVEQDLFEERRKVAIRKQREASGRKEAERETHGGTKHLYSERKKQRGDEGKQVSDKPSPGKVMVEQDLSRKEERRQR